MKKIYRNAAPKDFAPSSNLTRMQVEVLLEEQTPNYHARQHKAKAFLQELQQVILTLPERDGLLASEIEDSIQKDFGLTIPFPATHPLLASKNRYRFAAPESVETVGSFSLRTSTRQEKNRHIDLAVLIPAHLLEEKDFLDYRYIHKKAYYLACLAGGLKTKVETPIELEYQYKDDNELQPCLIVTPIEAKTHGSTDQRCVRLMVGARSDTFKLEKLRPWLSCLRVQETKGGPWEIQVRKSTALYNGTIVSDCSYRAYQSLIEQVADIAPGFKDACRLMRIWLGQRGIFTNILASGFGGFESSYCLAILLQENHRLGTPFLSRESNGFQLFRSVLQFLADRDLIAKPLIVGDGSRLDSLASTIKIPLLYDCEREHNVLFKMSVASYRKLQAESKLTIETLKQPDQWRFYPTFIADVKDPLSQYDYDFRGVCKMRQGEVLESNNKIHKILRTAFSDRVRRIDIRYENSSEVKWSCTSFPQPNGAVVEVLIGLLLNAEQVARQVDLGPLAEDKEAAAKFRKFWGDKAEMRRYKNGEIHESVTWSAPKSDFMVLEQIVSYIISRHFPNGELGLSGRGSSGFSSILGLPLPTAQALQPFANIESAFQALQNSLSSVSGHPLHLRQVSASASGLRYATNKPERATSMSQSGSNAVTIQFEGSMRWPEDLLAIQHTKVALLCKMNDLLETDHRISASQVILEDVESSSLSSAFLEVNIEDVSFQLRIYHDREALLLQHIIKDKSSSTKERDSARAALAAHKRTFVHSPRHTQAVRELCIRKPLLSKTIRLFKAWISAHLISSHFQEELLELIVTHTFTFPYPYSSPDSLRCAFLRVLASVSKWNWQDEPLIVNFATSPPQKADLDNIMRNFADWRNLTSTKLRPLVFVASNIDPEGIAWALPGPSIVAMNRLVSLARAARYEAACEETQNISQYLFTPSLKDFDIVIHLSQTPYQKRFATRSTSFAGKVVTREETQNLKHAVMEEFIKELEAMVSGYVVLFHNRGVNAVIGGLWVPRSASQEWRLGSSWGTMPENSFKGSSSETSLNREAILNQIANLGGVLISSIDRQDAP